MHCILRYKISSNLEKTILFIFSYNPVHLHYHVFMASTIYFTPFTGPSHIRRRLY